MRTQLLTWILIAACWLGSAAAAHAQTPDAVATLQTLFAEAWAYRLQEDPLFATYAGENRYNDLLPDVSTAARADRLAFWTNVSERLARIDRAALPRAEQVNLDVFAREVRDRLARDRFEAYLIPITTDSGFHIAFAQLPARMPFETVEDYENYAARLRDFPAYVDQYVTLMRRGLARGFTLPRVVLEGYEGTIDGHVVEAPEESIFYGPVEAFPPSVPEADRPRLRAAVAEAIEEAVVPGYATFLAFMVDEYMPGARETTGASRLPNGAAYYDYLIEHFTTLDLSAEEVHALGLREVERIRAEMEAIIEEVGFEGDFSAFLTFLRTDEQFYPDTPEALLERAAWLSKKMDAALPSLFPLDILPRRPYGVAPVPDHLAPKYTGGRYVGAPAGSREPGYYWVNTYALDSRPYYTLEALTLHEAVPGHHLQIALQQEMDDLPPFRRYAGISAFSEGWALYAERLGLEAGFYTDPYSNFGRLTYEMWRAARLVVDTGLHALGWTRDEAVGFLASNTALSLHEVGTEIDRYIAWPGQALSYKMGELKIRELRAEAEAVLGERFDVRAFHRAVLRNGAVPLPVLEDEVRRYIDDARAR